ncbi:MAG: hypothetical protein DHS20C18_31060 [Saprospiraceae bacterium]|nr:MAG: hypothetical protein DHS20C18_31060 [Saprospiraceae bacterium]
MLIIAISTLLAQFRISQSQYYSLNDGLSDRLVKDILFSKQGFVWIATENGLNRFNGYDFLIFDNNPDQDQQYEISANSIANLSEDRHGNIIIEYNSAVFFDILDPHSRIAKKVNLLPDAGIEGIPRKIHVDQSGDIFAVAAGEKLTTVYQYTYSDTAPFKKLFSLERQGNNQNRTFTIDLLHWGNGFFFINDSDLGLFLLDAAGELMQTFLPEHFDCPSEDFLYPRKAYFLHQDKQSRVWLAFNGTPGVLLFDPTELVFNRVQQLSLDNFYVYLWEDQKGNVLLAQTNTGGFFPPIVDLNCVTKEGKFLDFSDLLEVGNYITNAESKDFFKTIFFGIDTGFKVVQNNRTKVKTFLAKKLSVDRRGAVMRGITGDQNGNVYFAQEDDYWYKLDLETEVLDTLMMVDYDTGKPVDFSCGLSLHLDGKGTLWGVCCKDNSIGQILAYDLENCMVRTTLYEDRINAFTVDSAGIFWLGTAPSSAIKGELVSFNPETGAFESFRDKEGNNPLKDTPPRFILEGKDKTLWVGTEDGLFKIDREKSTAEVYRKDTIPGKGLSNNVIYAIYEDEAGKIWLGTQNGLNILDPATNKVEVYTRDNGLASNTVCGILPDGERGYWISTYNGLSFFDPEDKSFRYFFQADGFSHDEFNRFSYYKDENGRCYLGSVNGINAFIPDDLLVDKEIAKVILTKITRYNTARENLLTQETGLDQIDELVIEPKDSYFTLDFTLPVYRRSIRNQFKYYLEGYDKTWINNNNNHSIRFNRLPPRTYTLHVKGADPNGNWSNEVYHLKIRVEQVFYRKTWFVIPFLFIVGLGIFLFYKSQLDQKLKVERLRTKISSDLHDELSGLLTGIAMQTDILGSITENLNFKDRLKKIGIDSRTALSKMSDVIWSVDSRKDQVEDLIIRMQEHADEILLPMGIRYDVIIDKIDRLQKMPLEIRQDLYFIFKEAINNVGKHSGASYVKIILRNMGQHFEMVIHDNGKGNSGLKATPKGGQGISNLRMRADRLSAQLKLINENGFTVSLKMRRFLKAG